MMEMHSPARVLWDSLEADIVTGGQSSAPWSAHGVCLNINELRAGDLFLASKGDDLNHAFDKGASVVALSQSMTFEDCEYRPVIRVGSAFTALQSLSSAARFRTHATVISVQGREAREDMAELLSRTHDVHLCGKHVSLGLANLPEDADFGVFPASPVVKPDIVVITNPDTASRDTLFENMNVHGAVLINADSNGFIDTLARARAAGIQNIHLYGRHKSADAYFINYLPARNGLRVTGVIAGEGFSLKLGAGDVGNAMILPALCVLAMQGKAFETIVMNAQSVDKTQGESAQNNAQNSVDLIDENLSPATAEHAVMRVRHMVDRGAGRQMAMVEHLRERYKTHRDGGMRSIQNMSQSQSMKSLKIPYSFAHIDVVHRSKKLQTSRNAYALIKARYRHGHIEKVTPDSIAPGDFLVFREIWNSSRTRFSEALRLVPKTRPPANETSKNLNSPSPYTLSVA